MLTLKNDLNNKITFKASCSGGTVDPDSGTITKDGGTVVLDIEPPDSRYVSVRLHSSDALAEGTEIALSVKKEE